MMNKVVILALAICLVVRADHDFICEGDDCLPNGVCNTATLHCECKSGFYGDICDLTSCPLVCQNGGTCGPKNMSGENGESECQCPTGFFGTLCQGVCQTADDCRNGAECDTVTATCLCPPGFYGERCQEVCGVKCQNGSKCIVISDDHAGIGREYGCECGPGFSGVLCQDIIEDDASTSLGTSSSSLNDDAGEDLSTVVLAVIVLCTLAVLAAISYFLLSRGRRKRAKQKEDAVDLDLQEENGKDEEAHQDVDPSNIPAVI